jgi:hypothetical protein
VKTDKAENRINLMGGLGNQLFQLAFGLTATRSGRLEIVTSYGAPRKNKFGEPEIADFVLPEGVIIGSHNPNRFIAKLINFQLVRSITLNRKNLLDSIVGKALGGILSFKFRTKCKILVSSDVGFSRIPLPDSGKFIIGYFQSWKWHSEPSVLQLLKELRPKHNSAAILRYTELAEVEKPFLLHVRLGDYKNEAGIGLLGLPYYRRALDELRKMGNDPLTIWVFSDEVLEAKRLLEPLDLENIRFIEEDISSVETLELMRLCQGYIIANSTFSYWGAILSRSATPIIVAPDPWFQNAESPTNLIPDSWLRIPTN